MKCCPTCNRPFPPNIVVGGKRRQALLDFLLARPDGATVWEILDHVYADDPNGGPSKHNIVSVMVKQINRVLEFRKHTIRVHGTGGPGSRYFVEAA